MKIHAPLLPLVCCLMAGICAGSLLSNWTIGLSALVVCVLITFLLSRWPRWQTTGIWLCFLLLGMTLVAQHQQTLEVEWPEEATEQEVVVIGEPVIKEKWVVADVLTATGHQKLRLRIQRNEDSERIQVGDGLAASLYINKVRAWQNGHFDYRRYMQCHGFTGEAFVNSNRWQWQQVSLQGLSMLERSKLRFLCWRHQLLERYHQWGIHDDAYGVLAAMTLGEKSHINQEIRATYQEVGASHILALSGLHLMIIYSIISLLISWRRIRMLSQILIILAIWAFAFLTGLSPSVMRSATMITVYALLSLGYREKMSVNTLAFVAIIMLVINPLALYDIGFQLSFMAVLAIVLINPLLYHIIPLHVQMEQRWLSSLWGLTTVSLSAQIGTAPLVMYYFGYFSTLFLLTNYIVIPLATFILYLTPLLLAISWWSWGVALLTYVISSLVLLMNKLLAGIASLPYCSIDGINLSTLQVFLLYIIIGSLYVAVSLRFPATRRNG